MPVDQPIAQVESKQETFLFKLNLALSCRNLNIPGCSVITLILLLFLISKESDFLLFFKAC